ncbi:MAG TPA: DNA-directed RNA polymerase subunit omega [Bacteroidales bacterium]|nr:DNA-directed RNA polymerase subunit omega [Bacteroidales bacterium]
MASDYKKSKAPSSTITRDLDKLESVTGNIYETVVVLYKRANQISVEIKDELNRKLQEYGNSNDNLEEIFENREQIEVSKFYERLPKPTLIALQEYEDNEIFFKKTGKKE